MVGTKYGYDENAKPILTKIRSCCSTKTVVGCSLVLVCVAVSPAAPGRSAIDRGPLQGVQKTAPISVTVALALPGLGEAERLQQALYTPGDPAYHHFLSSAECNARFGPTDADVAPDVALLAAAIVGFNSRPVFHAFP
jgi:hypothetical protein